jgi:hypothetical protein
MPEHDSAETRPAGRGFDARAAAAALWRDCAPFWQAEADAVRGYLRDLRSPAGDVAWLRLAAYKETRLYRELSAAGRAALDAGRPVPGLDRGQQQVLEEEMRHYAAIAELVRALGGTPPARAEVIDFPADRALQAERRRMRESTDPVARCASRLVEGGGGALYRIVAALDATPFDRRLATVFSDILADELDHGPAQLPRLADALTGPADVERAAQLLHRLGRLRVEMRIGMFGLPEEAATRIRARLPAPANGPGA